MFPHASCINLEDKASPVPCYHEGGGGGFLSIQRISSIILTAAITLATAGLTSGYTNPAAHAATLSPPSKKQIELNGKPCSEPYGFTHSGTTYMPIWYIMQLLSTLQVKSHWDGRTWNLQLPAGVAIDDKVITTGKTGDAIELNGQMVERVDGLIAVDPASGQATTYMPIWYVIQLLNEFGIASDWTGTTWRLHTAASPLASLSLQASDPASVVPTPTVHVAQDDTSYFQRASQDMYLSAQTGNPLATQTSTTSMNAIQTGQPVYLFTWKSDSPLTTQGVTWLVNSSNATIASDTQHHWTLTGASGQPTTAAAGTFVANAPGVYTIQAESADGVFSVPLVVLVDQSSFASTTPSLTSASGLRAFQADATKPLITKVDGNGTSFSVYPATADGWIPVIGKAREGLAQVQVTFGGNPGQPVGSYALPVNAAGVFEADMRAPASGSLVMSLFTQYTADLTHWGNGQSAVDTPQTVIIPVAAAAPLPMVQDLFATAKMDYNLVPALAKTAAALYAQAGSADSAIEAINNYVAEDIVYDQTELQPGNYRFQDAVQTATSKLGVCEDDAELEADMLRSIGIPVETVQGVATTATTGETDPTSANGDNHEWLNVSDGTNWILADPTWSSADASTTGWLTNEFFTNTVSLQNTHRADAAATGLPEGPASVHFDVRATVDDAS